MSGDDTARALGAGGSATVTIAGKECTARPLSARELAELERICVQEYKDGYLDTIGRNIKRLPDKSRRNAYMEEQMAKAAAWTVRDLPTAKSYDPARIKMSDKLSVWIKETFDLNGEADPDQMMQYAAVALDQGMMNEEEYTERTGAPAPSMRVGYVNWWMTGCFDGAIAFIWVCFRDNGVTREEVASEMGKRRGGLMKMVREIESLSVPDVGNG